MVNPSLPQLSRKQALILALLLRSDRHLTAQEICLELNLAGGATLSLDDLARVQLVTSGEGEYHGRTVRYRYWCTQPDLARHILSQQYPDLLE